MVLTKQDLAASVQNERFVPGMGPGEAAVIRYVSFDNSTKPQDRFRLVLDRIVPPLATNGGVILEGGILTLPERMRFYPVRVNGDVEGWVNQIERGAQLGGELTAKIVSGTVVVSDGREYSLADCEFEFD